MEAEDPNSIIREIQSLYRDLMEEKNGKYVPGSNYKSIQKPSAETFASTVNKLIDKAKELESKYLEKYQFYNLETVMSTEIQLLLQFDSSHEPISNLQKLMGTAILQIELHCDVIFEKSFNTTI